MKPSISPVWWRSISKPTAVQRCWHQTAPWSVCTPLNLTGSVSTSHLYSKHNHWTVLLICSRLLCFQETLVKLLEGKPSCYSKEIQQLHNKHRKHFSKWMLQLQWVWLFPNSNVTSVRFENLYKTQSACVCADWDSVCWSTVWAARKPCWRTSARRTWLRKST